MARGLSLEEVARTTRVGQGYLEALEADDLDELPAPVFTKGFIRVYCQTLREPPDEALARYRELIGEALVPAQPAPSARPIESRGRGPVLVSLVLLIVLGLGLFALTLSLQRRAPRVDIPALPSSSPALAPIARPAPGLLDVPKPAEGGPARLVARAIEPTWISVQTDDGYVAQELLPAGATREWVSRNRFIVTIGNAGGVTLELNGQPLPPLGARGAVIRELILPQEPGLPRP